MISWLPLSVHEFSLCRLNVGTIVYIAALNSQCRQRHAGSSLFAEVQLSGLIFHAIHDPAKQHLHGL